MEETGLEISKNGLKRYWVGWTSLIESVETPFDKWKTRASRVAYAEAGSTYRFSYAGVVDAPDRESAWQAVVRLYTDAEELFVREKPADFRPPPDRFPKNS